MKTSWILELRSRLSRPPARRRSPAATAATGQAAFLVPLYVDAGELWVVLTQRTGELGHRGPGRPPAEVAFPGGELEPAEEPWAAAARKTEAEIGIQRQKILPLGDLDEVETASGWRIVPCVGAVPLPLETELDTEEIEELFSVQLSAFANPTAVEDRVVRVDGEEDVLRIYHLGSRQIWGLTARIMQNLLQRLGLEPGGPPN